jgi:hypothetical protein
MFRLLEHVRLGVREQEYEITPLSGLLLNFVIEANSLHCPEVLGSSYRYYIFKSYRIIISL